MTCRDRAALRRAARLLPGGRREAAAASRCVRTGMPAALVLALAQRGLLPSMLVRFTGTGRPGRLRVTEDVLRLAVVVCDAGAARGDGTYPEQQNTATVLDAAFAADEAGLPETVLHAWIAARMLLPRWDPHRTDEWNPPGLPEAALRMWTTGPNTAWISPDKSFCEPPRLSAEGLRRWLPAGVEAPAFYFAGYAAEDAGRLAALPCGHPDRPSRADLAVQAALLNAGARS